MRTLLIKQTQWIMPAAALLVALYAQTLFAKPVLKETIKETKPRHWLVQLKREMQVIRSEKSSNMQGEVKFVYGNDIWQPGRQFRDGGEWLALACGAQGCSLESATLKTKKESWQGHYDENATAGQRLHFSLNAKSNAKPVVWFRARNSHAWLKQGTVVTYYPGAGRLKSTGRGTLEALINLPEGATASLVPMLLSAKWSPELLEKFSPGDGSTSFLLQLRSEGKRQFLPGQLGTCSHMIDSHRYLLWAGDLDGDGQPDYLISFIDAEGPVHLYLSSAAKSGQLVGVAGAHYAPPFGGECDGGDPEM